MRRWRPELLALIALAALTRFWNLPWPDAVVFDEALYEDYIRHYFSGTYYFNVHPPVGKLLLAAAAWVLGISEATLAAPDPAPALRMLPALAGTLIVPVFWLLLRQLGANRRVAALGAFLLLADNALLTVSRFILIDSMLILFMLGAVCAYLASRTRAGTSRWSLLAVSALLAGLAAGSKWTGLSALAIVLLLWLQQVFAVRGARRELAAEALLLAAGSAAVYVGAFAVHFALLPNTGTGDSLMSTAFQETLAGSPTYRADARVSFPDAFLDLHRVMRKTNADLVAATHPGASPWWSWPVLKRPLYVWSGERSPDGRAGHVLIEGNPVLWWAILVALGVLAATAARARHLLAPRRDALLLLLAAYLINYLPFAFVNRILFLYSYLPALIFSLALAVVGIGSLAGWMDADDDRFWQFPARRSAAFYAGVAALTFAAFLYFSPISYGTPITERAFKQRMWLLERHVP